MKNFKKRLECNTAVEYYAAHWKIVNGIFDLDLTPRELDLLANFLAQRADEHTFDSTSRRIVMQRLGLSPSFISNYLKKLVEKNILIREEDTSGVMRTKIHPMFIPGESLQDYTIRIERTNGNTEGT